MPQQTKEEQLRREELSKERLKEAIYNLEIRVETAKDVELLTLIKEAYFLFPSLSSYKSELKEKIELIKRCEFEPDGEYHSCASGCKGVVENCKKCRRDRCSNPNCPLDKGRIENSKDFNLALDKIISILETDGK